MSPGSEPTTPSLYGSQSRRSSTQSSGGETVTQEVSPVHVKFVRDTSKYWYKPNISREDGTLYLFLLFYLFVANGKFSFKIRSHRTAEGSGSGYFCGA
jgi:hypothetical protein